MDVLKANRVLSKAVTRLMIDEGEVTNRVIPSQGYDPEDAAVDGYLMDMVAYVQSEYNVPEGAAQEVVSWFLADMMSMGVVPDIPDGAEKHVADWVSVAEMAGLTSKIGNWVKDNVEFSSEDDEE